MKAIIRTDDNDYVKGFTLECSPIETLILNSALREYYENRDENTATDRLIAIQMHNAILNAEECPEVGLPWADRKDEPSDNKCKGCIYEGKDNLMACVYCQSRFEDEPQTDCGWRRG